MTDDPDSPDDATRPGTDPPEDVETVYERMDPLEPYTTGELAAALSLPRRVVRSLLQSLNDTGEIRKKEPEPERVIWIREPPALECPDCGHRFEVKFLHPVLSSAQFCPRCGTQL